MRMPGVASLLIASATVLVSGCGAGRITPGAVASPAGVPSPGSLGSAGVIGSPSPGLHATPLEGLARLEARCRDRIVALETDIGGQPIAVNEAALTLPLASTFPSRVAGSDVSILIYTDGWHDISCISYPIEAVQNDPYWTGDAFEIEVRGSPYHFADRLVPEKPVAVGITGGSSEYGWVIWGAAAPSVAGIDAIKLDIDSGADAGVMTTKIANGYFVSFSTDGPCCLHRLIAYDATGKKVYASDG